MRYHHLVGAAVLWMSCAVSGEPGSPSAASYAAHLAAAHAHYRLGEYGEARRWLAEAPAEDRRWEYDYLASLLDTSAACYDTGHESINSLEVSPDGAHVAVGATDGSVEVRDAATMEIIQRVGDHSQSVYRARFSPDGARLITVSRDQRAVVWDLSTGRELSRFELPNPALADVAFSPDGALAAVVAWQTTDQDPPIRGMVRVWNAATGEVVREAEVGVKPLSGVEFTPDGSRLIIASWHGIVHVLDLQGSSPARDIQMPDDGLYNADTCVAVSRDGALAAVGSRDSTVRIIDLESERLVATLRGPTLDVLGVAFSRDGSRIACAGADGAVRLWSAPDWSPVVTLVGHTGNVRGIAFADDNRALLTAGYDGTIRHWDTAITADRTLRTRHEQRGVYNAAFSTDGARVAASCYDGRVHIWDARTGGTASLWLAHDGATCHTLCYSGDGSRLVTGSWDQTVRLWDVSTGALVRTFEHPVGVYDCAVSPDGARVAAGLTDGTVHLWTSDGSAPAMVLSGHSGQVMRVVFSHDGRWLASGGADGAVRIWSVPDGHESAVFVEHRSNVSGLAFSADDSLLASCGGDGKAILWDVAASKLVRVLLDSDEGLKRCAFSPDGSRLAVAGAVLRVVDVANGGSVLTLKPHLDAPYDVSFSPDGARVASCSTDGSIAIIGAGRPRALRD